VTPFVEVAMHSSGPIHAKRNSAAGRRLQQGGSAGVSADGVFQDAGTYGSAVVPPYPASSILRLATGDELGGTEAESDVADSLRRRAGAGRPLDRADAERFGAGFGADLSRVRVHADAEADSVARSVQSVAFTYGRDVYFTHGRFTPGTASGDRLLAHELAHVVQGSAGRWGAGGGAGVRIGRADDAAEIAADAAADAVMAQMRRGERPDPAVVGTLPAVAGEPIARTVRRAGIKSLAKRAKKKITGSGKKGASSHPAHSKPEGVVPIAQLKAASDAAHATRQQSGSSTSRSSSPRSSRSSRPRHHGGAQIATESGEGTEAPSSQHGRYGVAASNTIYHLPGAIDMPETDSSSHSSSESSGSSGSESEDVHYNNDVSFRPEASQHGRYGVAAPDTTYHLPGAIDMPEADSSSHSSSESSESSGSESEDAPIAYNNAPPQGQRYGVAPAGREYQVGGTIDLGSDSSSESSESESESDELDLGESSEDPHYTHNVSFEPEAPRPAAEPQPAAARKKDHRAFLIRHLPSSFSDETKAGKSGMKVPMTIVVESIANARKAIALLEGGGTVAAAIATINVADVAAALRAVGEDTTAALRIVRRYLDEKVEYAKRQDIPIAADGSLGDISKRKVHYDSKAEQAASLVTARGGKLYRSGGEAVDTGKSSTFHSGNGAEVFVASDKGEIHMASHQIGKYHHSSLLAGDKVSVGGEMKVTGGTIDWISNKSGHYQPTRQHLVQFVHWLGKDGVDLKSIVIREGFGFHGGMSAQQLAAGIDDTGHGNAAESFHAIKLRAVLQVNVMEEGLSNVKAALKSKGWTLIDGEVLTASTMKPVDPKIVIAALKQVFGQPGRAMEQM
jgi:hypothetical protein